MRGVSGVAAALQRRRTGRGDEPLSSCFRLRLDCDSGAALSLCGKDQPDQIPARVNAADVAALRDRYRRANLEEVAPDVDGATPKGDWIQLVGAAYDRTIYAFGIESTEEQDDEFIQKFNSNLNERHFNILFHNCADFVRQAVDFYYPHAIHRSFMEDMGIMTPKQAAKSLVSYSKHHGDLQFSSFVIPQVPGTIPRSTAVRGVLESLVKSKKYAVPLVTVAVLHPYFGGSLAFAWLDGSQFNPRRAAAGLNPTSQPAAIAAELKSNGLASTSRSERPFGDTTAFFWFEREIKAGARHKSGIAGVMWGRLAACAAVGYRRSVEQAHAVGRLTIGCSLPSCPTRLVCTYAKIPAVS